MGECVMNAAPNSNRELLIETCREPRSIIANTCFNHPLEHLVTCYAPAPGIGPTSDITDTEFAQLDYCLVDAEALSMIGDVWTDRKAALPTRHFLLTVSLDVKFGKQKPKDKK